MERPIFKDLVSKSYFKKEKESYVLHTYPSQVSEGKRIEFKTPPIPVEEAKYITYTTGENVFYIWSPEGKLEEKVELYRDIESITVNYTMSHCIFFTRGKTSSGSRFKSGIYSYNMINKEMKLVFHANTRIYQLYCLNNDICLIHNSTSNHVYVLDIPKNNGILSFSMRSSNKSQICFPDPFSLFICEYSSLNNASVIRYIIFSKDKLEMSYVK